MTDVVEVLCARCNSTDVDIDATVRWDAVRSRWKVTEVQTDHKAWCHKCSTFCHTKRRLSTDIKTLAKAAIRRSRRK